VAADLLEAVALLNDKKRDGKSVAGMGPQPPGMAGAPTLWQSYVMVDDLDAHVARVEGLGGRVTMPPMDVMTEGRMALVADPAGAMVGMWQGGDHKGAEAVNVPGALSWTELETHDLQGSLPFYAGLFGWRWEEAEGQPGYHVAMIDDKPGEDKSNCGAMAYPPGVGPEVPNAWYAYFLVESAEAAAARAKELGGGVFLEPMPMGPMLGAGITDPTGGAFLVGQFTAT
jgi:predicted enzyme related to lactoylglutathione lyase